MHTICVLVFFALHSVLITFALIMKKRFLTFLAMLLLPEAGGGLYAQDVVYLHCEGKCHAYDSRNVTMTTSGTNDIVMVSGGVSFHEPADSVTFLHTAKPHVNMGWWGDLREGYSKAYFSSHQYLEPDVDMLCADGICQEANCNIAISASAYPDSLDNLLKAGRKWRYVKNTLGGKGTFRFSQDLEPVEICPIHVGAADVPQVDLLLLHVNLSKDLSQLSSEDARHVLNYWYAQQLCIDFPARPVFGRINEEWRYEQDLSDSMTVSVVFDNPSRVTCDTIRISYPDEERALRDYESMLATDNGGLIIRLEDNEIVIVENFDAVPMEEAMRWLVRFDMDIRRPLLFEER